MKEFRKTHDESYYAFKSIHDNPIILDFTSCRYVSEIHKILKERFGLPEYYGENWDALWDCIRDLFYKRGEWLVLIYGFYSLSNDLQEYCIKMLEVFDDVHGNTPNVVFRVIS